jgi:hypothetical protein
MSLAEDIIQKFVDIDLSFYTSELDKAASRDLGMAKYLRPLNGLRSPFSRTFVFHIDQKRICYYKLPRRASTGILEAFLRLTHHGHYDAVMADLQNDRLYYAYVQESAKAFLSKDPVNDIPDSDLSFCIHREYHFQLASAIFSKVIRPYIFGFPLEAYVRNALLEYHGNGADPIQDLGNMTINEIISFCKDIRDDHFQPEEINIPPSVICFDIDRLDALEEAVCAITRRYFRINRLNSSVDLAEARNGSDHLIVGTRSLKDAISVGPSVLHATIKSLTEKALGSREGQSLS